MNFNKLTSQINYSLIGMHLLATFFIALGVRRLSMLYDIELLELISKYGTSDILNHLTFKKDEIVGERFAYYAFAQVVACYISLLIVFIISLIICLKKKIFLLNSGIVFFISIVVFILGSRWHLMESLGIQKIVTAIDALMIVAFSWIVYWVIATGILFISIGLFIVFNKWTMRAISRFSYQS